MKPSILFRSLFAAALVGAAQSVVAAGTPAAPTIRTNAVWHLKITGMHCDGCAGGIRSEVKMLPGVASADVRLKTADALVAVDTNKVSLTKIFKAVEEAGYKAELAK